MPIAPSARRGWLRPRRGIVPGMERRPVAADVREAFHSELDAGQQSALISWLAFTATFAALPVLRKMAGRRLPAPPAP